MSKRYLPAITSILATLLAASYAHAVQVALPPTAQVLAFVQGQVNTDTIHSSDFHYDSNANPAFTDEIDPVVGIQHALGSTPTELYGEASAGPMPGALSQTAHIDSYLNVSMSAGEIHAAVQGLTGGLGSGQARGEFKDQVTFHNITGNTAQIAVNYTVHGDFITIGPSGGASTTAFLSFFLNGSAGPDNSYAGNRVDFFHSQDPNPNDFTNTMSADPNDSPTSISVSPSGTSGSATIFINLLPGDSTFDLDELLLVSAGNADNSYRDTASLNFNLPSGVSFNAGALFLPAVQATPEPSSLLLLSSAALLTLRRRR